MSSNSVMVAQTGGHVWTKFEIHTLLCLMSRNIHVRGLSAPASEQKGIAVPIGYSSWKLKRKGAVPLHVSKRSAHMDVATALNRALNGPNLSQDIDHREISAMIDKIVTQKKGTLAVVQRQKRKGMTRLLKQILRRNISFTGDREEWNAGRKDEIEKVESERAERGYTMAMAGVGDTAGGGFGGKLYYQHDPFTTNCDDSGNYAAAPTTDGSQALDPWGEEATLTSAGKQNAVHWNGTGITASAENQNVVEVGWGAGHTTPEEYRPNLSTNRGDEDAQPVPLADIENGSWGSDHNTALHITNAEDDINADWGGGTAALVPVSSSSADPWDSAGAATFETRLATNEDHGASFPSTDEPRLTESAGSLYDRAVAYGKTSSGVFSDTWGEDGNEFENFNTPPLNLIGTTEPRGGANTDFNTPAQTSSSKLVAKISHNTLPATSADACCELISEELLQKETNEPLGGSESSIHGRISSFRMSLNPLGGEALSRFRMTNRSLDPKINAFPSSSISCLQDTAHAPLETPVHQTAMTTTTVPSNFLGGETSAWPYVRSNNAQTSPVGIDDQGINPERLAMLQEQQDSETSLFVNDTPSDDDNSFREHQKRWMPRGGNALSLPFNRLIRRNRIHDMSVFTDQGGNNVVAGPDIKAEATIEVNKRGGENATNLDNNEE